MKIGGPVAVGIELGGAAVVTLGPLLEPGQHVPAGHGPGSSERRQDAADGMARDGPG